MHVVSAYYAMTLYGVSHSDYELCAMYCQVRVVSSNSVDCVHAHSTAGTCASLVCLNLCRGSSDTVCSSCRSAWWCVAESSECLSVLECLCIKFAYRGGVCGCVAMRSGLQ